MEIYIDQAASDPALIRIEKYWSVLILIDRHWYLLIGTGVNATNFIRQWSALIIDLTYPDNLT